MSLPSRKPVNYLNNKDILKEIHESKNAYCHFTKPEYHRYDFIVDMPQTSIEESLEYAFKPETIQQAKETRALRLSLEQGSKDAVSPILDVINNPNIIFIKENGLFEVGGVVFNHMAVDVQPSEYIKASDFTADYKIALHHGAVNSAKTDIGYQISNGIFWINTKYYFGISRPKFRL